MELALEMELKATIIHEETKEYYEQWFKSEKTRKSLDSPYRMIWDGRGVRVGIIMLLYLAMASSLAHIQDA